MLYNININILFICNIYIYKYNLYAFYIYAIYKHFVYIQKYKYRLPIPDVSFQVDGAPLV